MPLTMAKPGEVLTIRKITGGTRCASTWPSWALWWANLSAS